eukprot:s5942_g5.t1
MERRSTSTRYDMSGTNRRRPLVGMRVCNCTRTNPARKSKLLPSHRFELHFASLHVESREYLRMQMHVETVMQQALISVINGALPADRACCAVSFNREGMV